MLNFLDSNSILFEKCEDCILCIQVDKNANIVLQTL